MKHRNQILSADIIITLKSELTQMKSTTITQQNMENTLTINCPNSCLPLSLPSQNPLPQILHKPSPILRNPKLSSRKMEDRNEKQMSVADPDRNQLQKSLHCKPKATTFSLPASSSSRKNKHRTQKSPPSTSNMSPPHRFSAELPPPAMPHTLHFRRSKSCGDGRSSSPDDFDIMSKNAPFDQHQNGVHVLYNGSSNSSSDGTDSEPNPSQDESFKCSALCLFFPGIYKKKPVLQTGAEARNADQEGEDGGSRVSKVASFERFECGSWASAANFDHDESGPLSYFDLPLELIRYSANESSSPVRAAFVFDKDLKSVLKKKSVSRLGSRKSCESNTRHVRFSTSSPTSYPASPASSPCITPRLVKARDEFNALLEATSV